MEIANQLHERVAEFGRQLTTRIAHYGTAEFHGNTERKV